jgi:transposase
MHANQLRLWFASMAYVLLAAFRRITLAHTELANATCGTIRLSELAPVSTGQVAQRWRLGDIPGHRLMCDEYRGVEVITGAARRRRWTTEQKLRIIEESFEAGETVSAVARRNGVAPNLLFRWRRLMTEGGAAAVGSDEPVVASSEVRRLQERVRELERLLGRKTMEAEILREALGKAEAKKPTLRSLSSPRGGSR